MIKIDKKYELSIFLTILFAGAVIAFIIVSLIMHNYQKKKSNQKTINNTGGTQEHNDIEREESQSDDATANQSEITTQNIGIVNISENNANQTQSDNSIDEEDEEFFDADDVGIPNPDNQNINDNKIKEEIKTEYEIVADLLDTSNIPEEIEQNSIISNYDDDFNAVFSLTDEDKKAEFNKKNLLGLIKETIGLIININTKIQELNEEYPTNSPDEQKKYNQSEDMKKFFDIVQKCAYLESRKKEYKDEIKSSKGLLFMAYNSTALWNIKKNAQYYSDLTQKTKDELKNTYKVEYNKENLIYNTGKMKDYNVKEVIIGKKKL